MSIDNPLSYKEDEAEARIKRVADAIEDAVWRMTEIDLNKVTCTHAAKMAIAAYETK